MVTVQFILTGRDLQDKNNVYTVDLNRGTILRVRNQPSHVFHSLKKNRFL